LSAPPEASSQTNGTRRLHQTNPAAKA
jgi:hypothetical protein